VSTLGEIAAFLDGFQGAAATSVLTATVAAYALKRAGDQVAEAARRQKAAQSIAAGQDAFNARIDRLSRALRDVNSDLQDAVEDMERELAARESALLALQERLSELGTREQDLESRIQALSKIEPEAVKVFAELTAPGEKRSARRDYVLFGAGAATSLLTSIVFELIG
jgi:TolA-binding protein